MHLRCTHLMPIALGNSAPLPAPGACRTHGNTSSAEQMLKAWQKLNGRAFCTNVYSSGLLLAAVSTLEPR